MQVASTFPQNTSNSVQIMGWSYSILRLPPPVRMGWQNVSIGHFKRECVPFWMAAKCLLASGMRLLPVSITPSRGCPTAPCLPTRLPMNCGMATNPMCLICRCLGQSAQFMSRRQREPTNCPPEPCLEDLLAMEGTRRATGFGLAEKSLMPRMFCSLNRTSWIKILFLYSNFLL